MYSVVIPFYNQSMFVEKTIQSVLNAIGPDDEIIAIDDCSPDHGYTWRALQANSSDGRVNIYQNEANKGHVYTLNRAADLAKGDVLIILGGDDLLGKDFTQWLTPHFECGADIVFSPVKFFYDSEDIVLSDTADLPTVSLNLFWVLFGWGKYARRKYSIIGCAIRKSSFIELEKFSTDVIIEDHDLFIKAAKQNMNMVLVAGSYSYYRQVNGSISSNMRRMIREDYRVIRKHTTLFVSYLVMTKRLVTFSIFYLTKRLKG